MLLCWECAENGVLQWKPGFVCLFVLEKQRPQVYEGMAQNPAEDSHVYTSLAKNRTTTTDSPYQNTVSETDQSNGYVKVIASTEYEMMEKSNQAGNAHVPAYIRMDASV